MWQNLKVWADQYLAERGLDWQQADFIEWLQEQMPEPARDAVGRGLRTVSSDFWGSTFHMSKLDENFVEMKVIAWPKPVRSVVHPSLISAAAHDAVEHLWKRHLPLRHCQFHFKNMEFRSLRTPFHNPLLVRFDLPDAQAQDWLNRARISGQVDVDCPVKVCDPDNQLIAEIDLHFSLALSGLELPSRQK